MTYSPERHALTGAALARPLLALSLGCTLLLALFWVGLDTQSAAAQDEPLTLEVTGAPPVADPGETIVYTATVTNNTDMTRTVYFSGTVSGPSDGARISLAPGSGDDVRTQRAARTRRGMRWFGTVVGGGALQLRITTRGDLLDSPGGTITFNAQAGPNADNPVLQDAFSVQINEPPPIDDNALDLSMSFIHESGVEIPLSEGDGNDRDRIAIPSGTNFRAHYTLTNTSNSPVVALLTGAYTGTLPSDFTGSDEELQAFIENDNLRCRVRIRGLAIRAGRGVALQRGLGSGDDARMDYAFLVMLEGNSTAKFDVQLRFVGGYACGVRSLNDLRFRALPADFDQPIAPRPSVIRNLLELEPKISRIVLILAALSDLGDAPDSTNHFGASMSAYAGVTANFPTVFDPATGLPQGPKHRFIRPFFLGDQVSREIEADLAFIAANRNLDPPNDVPDLDRFDDGVDVAAMNLQHCVTTVVPFKVTIRQVALDRLKAEGKTGYLNIWIDGNRDGDWDDFLDCDGIQAPEHIVIDQAVLPATAGVFNLVAPTGNLPIPLSQVGQPMWLRATLSDAPSEKTGQVTSLGQIIDYGDGRGPANAFRLGETEDYLATPASYEGEQGPDISIDVSVAEWEDIVLSAGEVVAETQLLKRVRLRNLGDMRAAGTLIIETTPNLGIPDLNVAEVETAVPAQLPFSEVCPTPDDCHIELPLAELAPGALRNLLLGWKVEEGESVVVDFNFRVEIEGVDANPGNNVFEVSRQPRLTPLSLLAPAPGIAFTDCLTCPITAGDVAPQIAGHGYGPLTATVRLGAVTGLPGATFAFRVNGELGEPQSLDTNGDWNGPVPLGLGDNLVSLEYLDAPDYDQTAIEKYNDTERKIIGIYVANNLPWDPSSFGVRFDGKGNDVGAAVAHSGQNGNLPSGGGILNVLDEAGNTATDGWILPVIRGQEMQISLNTTTCDCSHLFTAPENDEVSPGVTLQIGVRQPLTAPVSVNGGGLHQVSTTLTDVADGEPVTLTIGCEDDTENQTYSQCWVYTGVVKTWQPVQVVDGTSNTAVDGADFHIYRNNVTENGRQAVPWHSGAYGQANPVTTDANGEAFILLPPGDYGVTVRAEGYKPLRLGPLSASFFDGGRIELEVLDNDAATEELTYTDEGFSQATLEVTPGTRLRVINASLMQFEIQMATSDAKAAQVDTQSGEVAPGEEYELTFDTLGDVRLVNNENPEQELLVRVVESVQETEPQIFLPIMTQSSGE